MSFPNTALGLLIIGLVFSSIFYGVICLQVYLYFARYSEKDKPFLKFFVVMLLILDTMQLAFLVHGDYVLITTNTNLNNTPWTLQAQTMFAAILSATTQQFYAWRIHKLSMGNIGRIYIPIFIVTITISQLVIVLVYNIRSFQYPIDEAESLTPLAISSFSAWFSLELACSVIITSSMAYYLVVQGTKVKRSNASPARTIALYCLNSGLLIVVFGTLTLIIYLRYPDDFIYAPFFFILERLYSCSFMAILNSRDHLRNAFQADAAFATFSVSLTAPNRQPQAGACATSNVGGRLSRILKKTSTLRFTENERLSDGSLDSATIRQEDKQLPSDPLPTSDQDVAPIPPSFNHSSSLPPSHV